MQEYSGVLHIHSTYSDGTGSPDHIAQAANETGLDFLILTDHNTIQAKTDGYEKFYNNTLFIVGYELNDVYNKNHYLVFGLDELVGTYKVIENNELGCKLSASEYVSEIRNKGGVGFIAHPFEKRSSFPEHPPYPWTEWNTEDFDGIEIWNHMSEWVEGLNEVNRINRFIHPLRSVIEPCKMAVKKWDELNLKRNTPAVGSVDAHAHKMNLMGFYNVEVFPYKVLFKSIRTHVLIDQKIVFGDSDNFNTYKNSIIGALKKGRSFIANYYNGDAKGFRFFAEFDGVNYQMGDDIILNDGKKSVVLNFLLPGEAIVKVMRNGECIHESKGFGGIWDVNNEGCYRIECWKEGRAWIFSNHIRILKN